MTENIQLLGTNRPRMFKTPRVWESNVWAATIAGFGAGVLITIVGSILLLDSAGPRGTTAGAILILTILATFFAMFPGNLIAAVPIAIDLDEGKGLLLRAPLKKLYIPFEEIIEVRDSTVSQVLQQGIVVKLNKRHGLMKSFAIHWTFGEEGRKLARAIQQEISRR